MRVWGNRICPPTLDRALAAWLLNVGVMGRSERAWFEHVVRAGDTILDVGANQGIYAMLCARLVGAEGRVLAFEPEPELFAALQAACAANDASNVAAFGVAAGATTGRAAFRRSRVNRGDNRLTNDGASGTVTVEVRPLDDIVGDGPAHVVKIDVQGQEPLVVAGMARLLDRSEPPIVLFELWPSGLARAGHTPAPLVEAFTQRGFRLAELTSAGMVWLASSALTAWTREGRGGWTNLVAVKGALADRVGA